MKLEVTFSLKDILFTKDIFGNQCGFVDKLINQVASEKNNWGGFGSKEYLKETLIRNIFGTDVAENLPTLDEESIIKVIKETLIKASNLLTKDGDLEVLVFPTFSKFIIGSMDGSFGFTPNDSLVHLYVNPSTNNENFYKALEGTVAHEYMHTVRFELYPPTEQSLIETLVGEGLAENFKESVVKSKKSSWIEAISVDESKKIFSEIKDRLPESDPDFYRELFFNNEKYPLWSGYTIGYNLIKDFLERIKPYNWNEVVKMPATQIVELSKWA